LDTWILAPEWYFASWFFDSSSSQTVAWWKTYRVHGSPSQPSKIILWMYQVNWDGWEAMVWVPCWLDTSILAPEWYFASWFFDIQQHPNQPDARLRAHGSPSQPSTILLWTYQVNWDGWEAMVWVPCWLDTWILVPEWYFASWFFDIQLDPNRSLMQDLEPMDPLPNHPQSFCGCIKWI
jgi:hypothetical protein